MFDEISLEYWNKHKKKIGSSKSYTCEHDGYVYGDDMQYESVEFVYLHNGCEFVCKGKNSGPKWAYFELVEKACQQSNLTLQRFLDQKIAEKFRIYTPEEIKGFSTQQINSTRIKNGSGKITVNGHEYYVAHNLKICEYFNNAASCIAPSELSKWFIRIYFEEDIVKPMTDRDETELLENDVADNVSLTVHLSSSISSTGRHSPISLSKIVNIDYTSLSAVKKRIGDMGEEVVLKYEVQRLKDAGCSAYADLVEHSSVIRGDGLGYDIVSYQEDGKKVYIEVKSTKQNKPADFYLSKKEKAVSDEMYQKGTLYKIYRLYNLNTRKGTGDLIIYEPPFSPERYTMEPENWKIKLK